MIDRGHRILPDHDFVGNLRARGSASGAHVAVRQLEPRAGEGVCELVGFSRKRLAIFS
jgi:pyrimidine operon attenuation protein/uracil phosphoribosyltransferase